MRIAASAPRYSSSRDTLPGDVLAAIDALRDPAPAAPGTRRPADPVDAYLARLYYDLGWPVGALARALGTTSREAVHRRLRRGRDQPLPAPDLPLPSRPAAAKDTPRL